MVQILNTEITGLRTLSWESSTLPNSPHEAAPSVFPINNAQGMPTSATHPFRKWSQYYESVFILNGSCRWTTNIISLGIAAALVVGDLEKPGECDRGFAPNIFQSS